MILAKRENFALFLKFISDLVLQILYDCYNLKKVTCNMLCVTDAYFMEIVFMFFQFCNSL